MVEVPENFVKTDWWNRFPDWFARPCGHHVSEEASRRDIRRDHL